MLYNVVMKKFDLIDDSNINYFFDAKEEDGYHEKKLKNISKNYNQNDISDILEDDN